MANRSAFALAFTLLLASAAPAGPLLTFHLRELAVRADVVVVATPVTGTRLTRYRVCELLRGSVPTLGAEISIGGIESCVRPGGQPDPGLVDAALLFLRSASEGRLELVPSGVRLRTRDGGVWWPVQSQNGGGYEMVPEALVSWDASVLRARSDAAEAARVRAACDFADAGQRDGFLLDWVERHRHEFANGGEGVGFLFVPGMPNSRPNRTELGAFGWGELQLLPFTRVLQGRVPDDCLRAVNQYAELNHGATPPGAAAAFASREGRARLFAEARDVRQLDGHRARALRLLGDRAVSESERPEAQERAELVDGLLEFLKDRAPSRRGLASLAVMRIAADDGASNERAVNVLQTAYKAEQPGPARNALAEALYTVGGPQRWAKLSGRPGGGLALLQDLQIRNDRLFFWLTLKSEPSPDVIEAPTLLVERLDAKGAVAETKKLAVGIPGSPRTGGWNGRPAYCERSHTDLKPGTWRLRATGVTGRDKRPWESEPRTLQVVMPGASQARSDRSVLGTLLRSVTGAPAPVESPASPEDLAKRKVVLDGERF
jgi:hypothetical protein